MPESDVEIVEKLLVPMFEGNLVEVVADDARAAEVAATLAEWARPDFEWAMVGPEYTPGGQGFQGSGVESFREVWRDWLEPYESYEIELGETIDCGESVLTLVRQVATTKTGGVPIESFGAAVAWTRDGRLARVEFHLDRDAAMKAAGLSD
jgi:ketosteroid isomerase-like protein